MTPARQQLIADLEAAPCGSPELDARIAVELGWTKVEHPERVYTDAAGSADTEPAWTEWRDPEGQLWTDWFTHERKPLPPWTTSIDAAMTLMFGHHIALLIDPGDGRSQVTPTIYLQGKWDRQPRTIAATAPLAICAAAMKIGE